MKNTRKINLIQGEFNVFEAQELLTDLFYKNINFNKVKNFSSQIRFGEDDENALKQIAVLKESSNSIHEILNFAKAKSSVLKINATIEIDYEN